jgi:hypothetical protein
MNKQVCLVIFLLVYAYSTLVHAAPLDGVPPPTPQPPPTLPFGIQIAKEPIMKVVGVTEETFFGNEGILPRNQACNHRFPGSHWCTSREVMTGYDGQLVYPTASVSAWVQPSYRGLAVAPPQFYLDAGGLVNEVPNSDCNQWFSTNGNGRVVRISDGALIAESCDTARPAACCAFVSVP